MILLTENSGERLPNLLVLAVSKTNSVGRNYFIVRIPHSGRFVILRWLCTFCLFRIGVAIVFAPFSKGDIPKDIVNTIGRVGVIVGC